MSNGDIRMKKLIHIIYIYIVIISLASCYNDRRSEPDVHDALTEQDSIIHNDSLSFYSSHHYGVGYNFIVHDDSLQLIAQQPEEHVSQLVTDTFTVEHNKHLAVTDIRIIPQDSIDSVWVQLIAETGYTGWIHETELLPAVTPTDPISQFIMFFSDMHLLIALVILAVIGSLYIMRKINKHNAPMVHFRDIPSFYPTLLCITVAASATFYASLQMFGADTWRHFYYHPSLNPFLMPPILSIFISSVWAMLIIGIAAVEDTRHHLSFEDAILYLCGLVGLCSVLYIIFSISTLYYIGYPMLVAYCWFAVTRYMRHSQLRYICGSCGKQIRTKGKCPHCGVVNYCLVFAIGITALLSSCAAEDPTPTEPQKRTIIAYLTGDNNISYALKKDLNEMVVGSANLDTKYNLVVFADFSDEKPYIAKLANGKLEKVRSYDNDFYSTSPDSMLSVYQWIINNFPAEEYATIIGGHGSGSIMAKDSIASKLISLNAYFYDYQGEDPKIKTRTYMNIPSMAKVFSHLPKMSFIFFDCCCMQNLEVAYELRKATDYIISPVGETPEDGAPYKEIVPLLSYNKDVIGDSIIKHYIIKGRASYEGTYISTVRTSEIETLMVSIKNALASLNTYTEGRLTPKLNGCVYYYNTNYDYSPLGSVVPGLFDIKSVMTKNEIPADAMTQLQNALDKAVVCKYPTDFTNFKNFSAINVNKKDHFYTVDKNNYCGMSMMIPMDYTDYPDIAPQNTLMHKLSAIHALGWKEFGW